MNITDKEFEDGLLWAYYCGLNNVAPRVFMGYLKDKEHIKHLEVNRILQKRKTK